MRKSTLALAFASITSVLVTSAALAAGIRRM